MKRFCFLPCLFGVMMGDTLHAEIVTIQFEAEAATVVGQPFGIDVPRLTIVRGFLCYDTTSPDLSSSDPNRGRFEPVTHWGFQAEFLGHELRSSAMGTATTNLFGHTLAFSDGGDREETGDMLFDDVARPDIDLSLRISGDEDDLPSDQLPERFLFRRPAPFYFAGHTFSLSDDSGTMLLQLRSVRQCVEFPEIMTVDYDADEVSLTWCSEPGQAYAIAYSTDLVGWQTIVPRVVAELGFTTHTDNLPGRLGAGAAIPMEGFYRVLRLAPDR